MTLQEWADNRKYLTSNPSEVPGLTGKAVGFSIPEYAEDVCQQVNEVGIKAEVVNIDEGWYVVEK